LIQAVWMAVALLVGFEFASPAAPGDGENGGSDEVELREAFEEEKDPEGRICLSEERSRAEMWWAVPTV
jgi:hypothetical protein